MAVGATRLSLPVDKSLSEYFKKQEINDDIKETYKGDLFPAKSSAVDQLEEFRSRTGSTYINYQVNPFTAELDIKKPNIAEVEFKKTKPEDINFWKYTIKGTQLEVFFHIREKEHISIKDIKKANFALQVSFNRFVAAVLKKLSPKNRKIFKKSLKTKKGQMHFIKEAGSRGVLFNNVGFHVLKEGSNVTKRGDRTNDGFGFLADGSNLVYSSYVFPDSIRSNDILDHEIAHLLVGSILQDSELQKALLFHPLGRFAFYSEPQYLKSEYPETRKHYLKSGAEALVDSVIRLPIDEDISSGAQNIRKKIKDVPKYKARDKKIIEDLLMLVFCGETSIIDSMHWDFDVNKAVEFMRDVQLKKVTCDDDVIDSALFILCDTYTIESVSEALGPLLKEKYGTESQEKITAHLLRLKKDTKYWDALETFGRYFYANK